MDKKKFDKEKFELYYKDLTEDKKKYVREEFLKMSGLSYPAWFTKRQRGSFTLLEIDALKRITGRSFIIA